MWATLEQPGVPTEAQKDEMFVLTTRAHKNEKQGCVKKDEKCGSTAPAHKRRGRAGLTGLVATNLNLVSSAPAHKNEKQENVAKQEMSGCATPAHKRRGSAGLGANVAFTRG